MRISKRALITVVGAAIAALSMALGAGAFGAAGGSHRSHSDHHGKHRGVPLINEALAPSQPTDPALHEPLADRSSGPVCFPVPIRLLIGDPDTLASMM